MDALKMNNVSIIKSKIRKNHSCSGFSLIEVLVALLILAIGILGIAALQFKALKYGHDANTRTQISYLASDMADRMRINRTNMATYVSNHTVDIANLGASACNPATAADKDNDLGCWYDEIDAILPHGSTAIITNVDSLMTISLAWSDREGNLPHVIEYSFQ